MAEGNITGQRVRWRRTKNLGQHWFSETVSHEMSGIPVPDGAGVVQAWNGPTAIVLADSGQFCEVRAFDMRMERAAAFHIAPPARDVCCDIGRRAIEEEWSCALEEA